MYRSTTIYHDEIQPPDTDVSPKSLRPNVKHQGMFRKVVTKHCEAWDKTQHEAAKSFVTLQLIRDEACSAEDNGTITPSRHFLGQF